LYQINGTISVESQTEVATTGGAHGKAPDVLVLVLALPATENQVSITYSRLVAEDEAKQDVAELCRRGAWVANGMSIVADRPKQETSITFRSPVVATGAGGVLPLSPFIETWKRFNYLRLVFICGGGFSPRYDWERYTDRNVDIRFKQAGSTFTFDVYLRRHAFDRVSIPLQSRPDLQKNRRTRKPGSWGLALSIFALPPILLVLVMLLMARRRRP